MLSDRKLSGATSTLAQAFVNSHISPKPGEIWGTRFRGRENTPQIPPASVVGKLHPKSLPQPLPGDVEGFGQHSRFANHRHEVGISEPTGQGMHMEMWGNAGSGGLA